MKTSNFREFLRDELVRRCKKNPSYSLRSFASSLGMNHALVSMIIRGKRSLTPATITKIGSALGLSPTELNRFLENSSKKNQIKKMNDLTLDTFHMITEWYHDAIMELSRVKGFVGTAKYVSSALGISIGVAQDAIERLSRLGLISILPDGTWEHVESFSTIQHNDFTSPALRAFQKNILNLSSEAVNAVPKNLRDHTCITVAMSTKDLTEIKEKIKTFRREMMAFLHRKEAAQLDDVYCMSLSLFPLTKFYKKKKEE